MSAPARLRPHGGLEYAHTHTHTHTLPKKAAKEADVCLFVCLLLRLSSLIYKTGANIMQIGALFASRQPISSNPGAVLFPRLSKINITPDATVIRITVPIPSAIDCRVIGQR